MTIYYHTVNPLFPDGTVCPYKLGESISQLRHAFHYYHSQKTLVRHRVLAVCNLFLQCICVCAVCLCPIYETTAINGLAGKSFMHYDRIFTFSVSEKPYTTGM